MEILGVGIPEMAFIVLIALILLGPKDMIAASRTLGKFLRKFLTSPTWQAMRKTGEELQQLPTKLVREAGLEDLQNEVQGMSRQIKPINLSRTFDEAKIFDPNSQTTKTEKVSPPTLPETLPPGEAPEDKPEPPTEVEA